MTEIWWVEDFLSGQVLENRYYSEQSEAVAARTRLGYGLVKSFEIQDGGIVETDGTRLVAEFE